MINFFTVLNLWQIVLIFYTTVASIMFIVMNVYAFLNGFYDHGGVFKMFGFIFLFCAVWLITLPWFIYEEVKDYLEFKD
jgi:hypothetical protein